MITRFPLESASNRFTFYLSIINNDILCECSSTANIISYDPTDESRSNLQDSVVIFRYTGIIIDIRVSIYN